MIRDSFIMKGHTRPMTQVEFNREGDLLFTASKDNTVTLWRTVDAKRMGVYHATGALRGTSVSPDSRFLATAGADEHVYVFDVQTGERLADYHDLVSVVDVNWNANGERLLVVTDAVRAKDAHVYVFAWDAETHALTRGADIAEHLPPKIRVTQAKWGPLDETVVVTADTGHVYVYSCADEKVVRTWQHHTNVVTSLVFDRYKLLMMTASKDGSAHLYNARTCERLKTYTTGRPINACSISPVKDEVLLGGGQEAREVTTTNVDQRQFMAHFFDLVHETNTGLVRGHFSPINCASYSPDGRFFATGGEDGKVRLYRFGDAYFDASLPKN